MGTSFGLKRTADLLTLIRLVGVVIVPVIGLIRGPSAVSGAGGWLLLLLWLTDLFDGQLARKSGLAGEGIFGKLDPWADLALGLGSFTLLTITGFVNVWVYGAVVAAVVVLGLVDFLVFQVAAIWGWTILYFVIAVLQDPTFLVGIALLGGLNAVFSRGRFVFLWNRFWGHVWNR